MDLPQRECDIVMKGGITSGVVYPGAVLELAKLYRFRSIGGTSAGAIAAGITAAAEYGRASPGGGAGFAGLAKLPDFLQKNLASLFQPAREGRGLFDLALSRFFEKGWGRIIWTVIRNARTLLNAGDTLKTLDYGLCPGLKQEGATGPGLSDWLAEEIERLSGRLKKDEAAKTPLTFGDLWAGPQGTGTPQDPAIELRMMTTNLSMRRPNALPFMDDLNYAFNAHEFRRLFPDWVVDFMIGCGGAVEGQNGLYRFPLAQDLPVVVGVRMSLSFPFLISAVPLYRRDFQNDGVWRRMLFSDGGLSSNMPVHFFDAVLPCRPTFGISLDAYNPNQPDRRVRLPVKAKQGRLLGIRDTDGVFSFAMSLMDAAKDWQDQLQVHLVGYRERIVSVYLKDTEGGLNLDMPAELVTALDGYGARAGALLAGTVKPEHAVTDVGPFDFDAHRWRRFLVAYGCLEQLLSQMAEDWGDPADPGSFSAFVAAHLADPPDYTSSPLAWRQGVRDRFDALMRLGAAWNADPYRFKRGGLPKQAVALRIVPVLGARPLNLAAKQSALLPEDAADQV